MYCQSCGVAIAQPMKYCNRCGALQVTSKESTQSERQDKRLNDYLDGLFWITVFGVVLTVGGMIALKKLEFSDAFIVAFLILSASAFLLNLALNMRVVVSILKSSKAAKPLDESPTLNTNELEEMKTANVLQPVPSVTENTTRSFEPTYTRRSAERSAERYRMKDD